MTSHLTPEQRPDKNGNIVTRWVRNTFSPKKASLEAPRVVIDVGPTPKSLKKESRELYDRLMAALPDDDFVELLADADNATLRQMNNRSYLESFNYEDYEQLKAFDAFGAKHSYEDIAGASLTIKHKFLDVELTDENITAYTTMKKAVRAAILRAQDEEKTPIPKAFTSTLDLCEYVLVHPEDTMALERILEQGVNDRNKIYEMLAEIKEGRLNQAISEGFL